MLRKNIHFFYGIGIGILLIPAIYLISTIIHSSTLASFISGGLAGGITGLFGVIALQGKAKMFTLGLNTFWFVICIIFLVFGIFVFPREHPLGLWIAILMALPGMIFFGFGFWFIPKRAREAELRKMMSEDLTLESKSQTHNEEEKEYSNE